MSQEQWIGQVAPAVVAVSALLAGLALVWLGRRGRRVDDHPVCRRCGFDLFGVPVAGRGRCSECGADVTRRRAVRVGTRARRPGLIGAGVVLLLPAAGATALLGWAAVSGADVNHYKPVWWLSAEARNDRNIGARDKALAELTGRLVAGTLTDEQLGGLLDSGLGLQGDVSRRWTPLWGDFIEAAERAGKLPPEQWRRYAEQSHNLGLRVRPAVRRGDPLPYEIARDVRMGTRPRFQLHCTKNPEIQISGRGAGDLAWCPFAFHHLRHTDGSPGSPLWSKQVPYGSLADGSQSMRVTFTAHVQDSVGPWGSLRSIVDKEVDLTADWSLLPADEPSVRAVTDASLRDAVRAAISVGRIRVSSQSDRAAFELKVDRPPVGLACTVSIRGADGAADSVVSRELLEVGAGESTSLALDVSKDKLPAARVDVVLRPDFEGAAYSLDLGEIWGEPIVIEDVPVESSNPLHAE